MKNNKQRPLPDFIGIGAQRCGTTWLYRHMSLHPDVWMPPVKEIHFFDRIDNSTHVSKRRKFFRDLRKRYLAYKSPLATEKNNLPNLFWDISYFLQSPSFKWYTSLFIPGIGKITGEITPEYMALNQEMVENIYAHNPKMKIIFTMRDPIDRIWSAAVKKLAKIKKRDVRNISADEFQVYLQHQGTSLRSNYVRTLSIWESVFPSEQMHIDFYDNIQENPKAFLLRIFEFLGVEESTEYITKDLHKKIATTEMYKTQIPHSLEFKIAEENIDQLEKLSIRFGGHTTKWFERSKNVLEKKSKT